MSALAKLASIAGAPLSPSTGANEIQGDMASATLVQELNALLRQKNGFFAFESALHCFPAGNDLAAMSLDRWNSEALWRFEYGDLARGKFFFAEDAFGNQFCLQDERVTQFDAETGDEEVIADSLEGWAERILTDYSLLTGYPLLHEWQSINGRLAQSMRLMTKVPFVLGGEYAVGNLYALASVTGMRTRGNLARQICDLPDGSNIRFEIVE